MHNLPTHAEEATALFLQLLEAAASDHRGYLRRYLADIARSAWAALTGQRRYLVTGRTALQYLNDLRFIRHGDSDVVFDFRQKRILDVGAGRSRFVDVMNRVYGHTGTVAIAMDLHAFRHSQRRFARADARHLPFPSESFDVVLSHGCVTYCLLSPSSAVQASAQAEAILGELLRVTTAGGELRFTTFLEEHVARACEYLDHHARVKDVELSTGSRFGVQAVTSFLVHVRQ